MEYTSYSQLVGKTLKQNDIVIFCIKGKRIIYAVYGHFLSCLGDDNEIIFKELKLNKMDFCRRYYGYQPSPGDWPVADDTDLKALTRVVLALFKKIKPTRKALEGDLF